MPVTELDANVERLVKAARRAGVSERIVLGIVRHEGGFKTDPGGNGGGMGQFTTDTAKAFGVTQDQLRRDPDLAAEKTVALIKQLLEHYDGDEAKASAAYFLGQPNIDKAVRTGRDNWVAAADEIAQQYNQGTASDYLSSVGVNSRPGQLGTPSTSSTRSSGTEMPEPSLEDFVAELGPAKGYATWLQAKTQKAELDRTPQEFANKDFIQALQVGLEDMGKKIDAGSLSLTAARDEFSRQLGLWKEAGGQYANLLGYAIPKGAMYVPGREPGGFYEKMGLAPLPTAGNTVEYNPFQSALDISNSTPNPTNPSQVYNPTQDIKANMDLVKMFLGGAGRTPSPTVPITTMPSVNPAAGGAAIPPGQGYGPPAPSGNSYIDRMLSGWR